jgi:hypothetical protein
MCAFSDIREWTGVPFRPEIRKMDGPQADEAEELRRAALIAVGNGLRDHYGDVLKEEIPKRLTDLLRRLVAPNEAGGEEQRSKKIGRRLAINKYIAPR